MLKARYGDRNLVIGLSRENISRLLAGKPIRFDLAELNLPAGTVVIFFGETEQAMLEDLEKHGLAPAASRVPPAL
jgi:hypothetical protein